MATKLFEGRSAFEIESMPSAGGGDVRSGVCGGRYERKGKLLMSGRREDQRSVDRRLVRGLRRRYEHVPVQHISR